METLGSRGPGERRGLVRRQAGDSQRGRGASGPGRPQRSGGGGDGVPGRGELCGVEPLACQILLACPPRLGIGCLLIALSLYSSHIFSVLLDPFLCELFIAEYLLQIVNSDRLMIETTILRHIWLQFLDSS